MAPTSDIITQPVATAKPKVWEYNAEQQAKIEELRVYANSLVLPESDPYHPNELKWLADPGCIPRYMRASKWRVDEGKRRIKGTLEWRREYKPDLISADEVKVEAETGKIVLNGFDSDGRPVLYLRPGRENTKESPLQIRHLVFHIERAIDFMPPGQEAIACLVDYNSTTLRTSPSISNARKFLTIIQQHYVERLGRAIVVNLPMILNFFFKGISPFLDPVTRDKMRFNPNLLELFPAEQLDASVGGKYEYEFDHETYWTQICKHAGVNPDGSRFEPDRSPSIPAASAPAEDVPSVVSSSSTSVAPEAVDSMSHETKDPLGEKTVEIIDAPNADEKTQLIGSGTVQPSVTGSASSQEDKQTSSSHAINPAQLQAMRQGVINKYEQTGANLERNTKKEEQPPAAEATSTDASTTTEGATASSLNQ